MKGTKIDTIDILDQVAEIKGYIAADRELTQQLVDLSNYPDKYDRFEAYDYARIATQEKLYSVVIGLEKSLRGSADD